VAELYCGIGGCAAAVGSAGTVVAAVDINRKALEVYRWNFPHPTATATIESLGAATLKEWRADLWWMSPPCQPFTQRGRRRDLNDSRTQSFLDLVARLKEVTPTYLGVENVPGFRGSITHSILRDTLDDLDYQVEEWVLCPTAFGIPNRRERFYLVAGRTPLSNPPPPVLKPRSLDSFLDAEPAPDLWIDPELAQQYRHALNLVDPSDPEATAACFTSAYSHSPVRSGSYLQTPTGPRRFSPAEILRLLGFASSYTLPPDLPKETAWRLVGNSLSVPAVRYVLATIPELSRLVKGGRPTPRASS
jgi:site-specific DNA-cytosine methylase